ncbi:MAG: DNA photolyase [Gammaproteobacteria bacterium]|nr:DNA photolyase [Gammaproteobacteria bacterium]
MVSSVYIESEIRDHPRARKLLERLRNLPVIEIEHYGEVFNPRAQNFRLQKKNPAIIIARKNDGHVLAAPQGYGLGGNHNYYFSHMLNCIYDCRYCFLQGMYQSAHQILFINYEDFGERMEQVAAKHQGEAVWFYSGYDCDSLANEPMTEFTNHFIPLVASIDNAWMELRTKSTQVRSMLKLQPCERVVTAFSFTDPVSHAKLEHGVPSIAKRVDAMRRLIEAGWTVGLRFDPVVYHRDYQAAFVSLLDEIFTTVDPHKLHSVSLGSFRLTRDHFRKLVRIYPEEPLFAQKMDLDNGIISYPREREREMIEYCEVQLMKHIPQQNYHPCEWHG